MVLAIQRVRCQILTGEVMYRSDEAELHNLTFEDFISLADQPEEKCSLSNRCLNLHDHFITIGKIHLLAFQVQLDHQEETLASSERQKHLKVSEGNLCCILSFL